MDKLNLYYNSYNTTNILSQNDPNWILDRLSNKIFIIGGSEIASFLDKSFFKSKKDLLYSKLTKQIPQFSIETLWGQTFEKVALNITELYFYTNILNFTTISNNDYKYLRYSPDGIGIIRTVDGTESIVLFEIKCPYSRIIKPLTIPNYYLPQIQMGLQIIPIIDYGIFGEFVFKKVSIDDFHTINKYNTYNDRNKTNTFIETFKGYLFLYVNDKNDKEYCKLIEEIKDEEYFDIGLNNDKFEHILYLLNIKRVFTSVVHIYENKNKSVTQLYDESNKSKNNSVRFILPWKLFCCSFVKVDKKDIITDNIQKDLEIANNFISEMKDKNSEMSKYEFYQYYSIIGNVESDKLLIDH